MCLFWRSPTAWSPESASGDFVPNLAIAYSGKLEIGTRQLNYQRLHVPPDFLPNCQPGALSTRLYCSRMPRHRTRPPGWYINVFEMEEYWYFDFYLNWIIDVWLCLKWKKKILMFDSSKYIGLICKFFKSKKWKKKSNVSWPANPRADPYAGWDRESNPHSLRGAGQVQGGPTCFATPRFWWSSLWLLLKFFGLEWSWWKEKTWQWKIWAKCIKNGFGTMGVVGEWY